MTDRYKEMRAKVAEAERRVVGMKWDDAVALIANAELACRILSADGQACMITSDCRMDRIGFHLVDGVVTEAHYG